MSVKINIVSMRMDGHEVTITDSLSELLSNPTYWSKEEYVAPDFLKNYTSFTERNQKGYLVTTCTKNPNINKEVG